jgi:valyl-tRNA synthetase
VKITDTCFSIFLLKLLPVCLSCCCYPSFPVFYCYCNCNIVNSLHLSIKDLYRGTKNTVTSLRLCSRSKDVVEPMMRPQWFVSCNSMAKVALDAVKSKKIEIIPPQYEQDWYR